MKQTLAVLMTVATAACAGAGSRAGGSGGSAGAGGSAALGGRGGSNAIGGAGGVAGAPAGSGGAIAGGGAGGAAGLGGSSGVVAVGGSGGTPAGGQGGNGVGPAGAGGTPPPYPGIGSTSVWNPHVQSHTAGPYVPCGVIGSGTIASVAARPGSTEIAAGSRSGIVSFYSSDTGKQLRAPFYAPAPVAGVAYSGDGSRLVVAGDGGVQVVDVSTGAVTWNDTPFAFSTRGASLSPDGTLIAALGWDAKPDGFPGYEILRLVRVADKSLVGEFPDPLDVPDGYPPQFSPDGTFLACASQLFAVPSLQQLPVELLSVTSTAVGNIALSPDGTLAARGGGVWKLSTGELLKPGWTDSQTYSVAFSPDGQLYAELDDRMAHLYSTKDWSEIASQDLSPFPNGLLSGFPIRFSGDGKHLVIVVEQQYYQLAVHGTGVFEELDVPSLALGPVAAEPLPFYGGPLGFAPDGSILGNRMEDGTALWNPDGSFHAQFAQDAGAIQFLANGMLMLGDGWIHDPTDGHKVAFPVPPWLWVSPDGRFSTTSGPTTNVVRLEDATPVATLANLTSTLQDWFVFSADSVLTGHARSGMELGPVTVFDTASGALLTTVTAAPPLAVATRGPTAGLLIAAPDPIDLRAWTIPGGSAQYDIPHAVQAAFSSDGSLLAVAADDGIRILDADTGAVRQTLLAHVDPLASRSGAQAVAFSPTGQIASAGWDSTVRLWCSP